MRPRNRILALAAAAAVAAGAAALSPLSATATTATTSDESAVRKDGIGLTFLGRYSSGSFDESAAEITAYDADSRRLFTVNAKTGTVDILDLSDPARPRKTGELATPGANSVTVHRGLVAVAQQAAEKTDPGTVSFFRAADGAKVRTVTVGALPDMVTFTPDGRQAVVANEGEPDSYCDKAADPAGSVSVIDVARGTVRTAGFEKWDGKEDELRAAGVRITGPGASASQDLEPEYVAVSANSRTAWVTLQENNALAVVDLKHAKVRKITPLGLKDHSLPGNALDPSDKDGGVNIAPWPVRGMYQPDSIAAFTSGGGQYTVSANEGDAREYDCYEEEVRVKNLELSPAAFPNAAELKQDAALGRLKVTSASPRDAEGRVTELHAFGGRSISVRDAGGALVWDSGDDLERLTARLNPAHFNSTNSKNDFDSRSTAKGPEPEGITTGTVDGTPYAFVGLERVGGIVAYDLSDPRQPKFAAHISTRDFTGDPAAGTAGDLAPEGLSFIPAADSPNGRPLLVVGHEVSGTTAVYQVG
jgi:hypothetical protein